MHTIRLTSIGMAALLMFGACNSNDSNVSEEGLSSTGGSNSGTNQAEKINLFSYWNAPGDVETMHALIEVHRDMHPADSVVVETGVSTVFGGPPPKTPPDVSMVYSSFLPDLSTLRPLDDFLAAPSRADNVSKVYPEFIPVSPDGSRYSIPLKVSRLNTLFYNKYVFRAHNLTPPTNMDELRAVCETLKAANVTCVSAGFPSLLFESLVVGSLGVEGYVSYRRGTVDEAALRKAVDVFAEVVDKYADLSFTSIDAAFDAFINQKIGIIMDGSFSMGPLQQLGQTAGVDFGVSPPPGNAGLFIYNVDSLAISATAANPEGAARFLDSALSFEAVTAMSSISRQLPVRSDVDLPNADSETSGLLRDLREAKYRLPDISMPRFGAVAAFLQSSPRDKELLVQALLQR